MVVAQAKVVVMEMVRFWKCSEGRPAGNRSKPLGHAQKGAQTTKTFTS